MAKMAALILGVLGGSSFAVAQTYKCDWAVNGIAGGGMSGAAYRAGATAGQTAAGQLTGAQYHAFIGFWQADMQVGVKEVAQWPGGLVKETRLHAPAPNPFTRSVAIRYSLAAPGSASLRIYDQSGRVVREFAVGVKHGTHSVRWDGRDAQGRLLANGVYFCRLVVGLGHDPDSKDGIGSCPAPRTAKLVLQR